MFIYNPDAILLNPDGLRISASSYKPKITFDDAKKEIERTEAFQVFVNKDNVEVVINDQENYIS